MLNLFQNYLQMAINEKLNVMINKIVMTDKKPIIWKNLFKNLSMFNLLFK